MENETSVQLEKTSGKRMKFGLKLVIALFCLSLIAGGPGVPVPNDGSLGVTSASAQGNTQDSGSTDAESDDTPSEADISDFASEYDKDGDGEVDEPEDDEEDDAADDPADDEQDADDDQDDDTDDDDQDDERDDDDDGQEHIDDDDPSGDLADSREDVDGDASPDYRVSGFNRYRSDKSLRRLGEFGDLTPLIDREETMLFEN